MNSKYVATAVRRAASSWLGLALVATAVGVAQAIGDDGRFTIHRNIVYAEQTGVRLKADLYVPQNVGPYPGVLVVHGGAWMSGHRTQLAGIARALAKRGFTAMAISYRLAPQHKFPAQIDDCRAAVRWMRTQADQYKIDPQRIGGYGYSAGGQLVALLGMSSPKSAKRDESLDDRKKNGQQTNPPIVSTRLQAIVAGGAPCDFRPIPASSSLLAYWLGGSRAEKPDAYRLASPAHFVSHDDPPIFLFHGEKDRVVPIFSPLAMEALLRAVGVEAHLHQVSRAGHVQALFDKQATAAAIAFLQRKLQAGDPPPSSEWKESGVNVRSDGPFTGESVE